MELTRFGGFVVLPSLILGRGEDWAGGGWKPPLLVSWVVDYLSWECRRWSSWSAAIGVISSTFI